jgi:hypothetical protein
MLCRAMLLGDHKNKKASRKNREGSCITHPNLKNYGIVQMAVVVPSVLKSSDMINLLPL